MKKFAQSLFIVALSILPVAARAATLTNPLGGIEDPQALAIRILQILLGFVAIIGLIMFIYGGFMMLTSGGNADRIKKAKETLVWAGAGIVVIMGSYTILQFVFNILQK